MGIGVDIPLGVSVEVSETVGSMKSDKLNTLSIERGFSKRYSVLLLFRSLLPFHLCLIKCA